MNLSDSVLDHYTTILRRRGVVSHAADGPRGLEMAGYRLVELAPTADRREFFYGTTGMSLPGDQHPTELHAWINQSSHEVVQCMHAIAHFHRYDARLGIGHTVRIGRPWIPSSKCVAGLVSLPYLDGPQMQHLSCGGRTINCLWIIPITEAELEFKKRNGIDSLEQVFELAQFDYSNLYRDSAC